MSNSGHCLCSSSCPPRPVDNSPWLAVTLGRPPNYKIVMLDFHSAAPRSAVDPFLLYILTPTVFFFSLFLPFSPADPFLLFLVLKTCFRFWYFIGVNSQRHDLYFFIPKNVGLSPTSAHTYKPMSEPITLFAELFSLVLPSRCAVPVPPNTSQRFPQFSPSPSFSLRFVSRMTGPLSFPHLTS